METNETNNNNKRTLVEREITRLNTAEDIGSMEALNHAIVTNAPKGLARFELEATKWMNCNKESELWITPDTEKSFETLEKGDKEFLLKSLGVDKTQTEKFELKLFDLEKAFKNAPNYEDVMGEIL